MPHYQLGVGGKLAAGMTAVGGAASVLSIAAKIHPALESVKLLKESFELHSLYIHGPAVNALSAIAGVKLAGLIASTVVDLLVFWLSFFVAVNVFVYKYERNFLPAHISRNYCQLAPRHTFYRMACVTPKLIFAFLAAPIVCALFGITKLGSPSDQLYSSAYLTIHPRTIFAYLLTVFGIAAIVLVVAEYSLHFLK